jgi:AcrR family transcriptional regulator
MKPARDRILAAAERIHRKAGIEALSMRAVAKGVGITPMAIYRHFRDKNALIAALVELGFARWEQHLAEAVRARTPRQRIEHALVAYAEFALDEPRMFELMFLVPRQHIPQAPASLASTPSRSFASLIAAVHDYMREGRFVHDDPAEIILFAWSAAHGLIALHFSGRFGGDDRVFRPLYATQVRRLLRLVRGG